jgi:hypothetical protein
MELVQTAPLGIAILGLALGMRHATDPDHVVAVSTIVTRERRLGVAARIGMWWGIGHTLTIMLVGVAIIVFKVSVPPRVGLAMEFAVAIVLILLGISALTGLLRAMLARLFGNAPAASVLVVHAHEHSHGGVHHQHPHAHWVAEAPAVTSAESHVVDPHRDHWLPEPAMPAGLMVALGSRFPNSKAFGVGLVHGLAGSAAIALLVLGAILRPLWAVMYLFVFGIGTVLGMVLITTAIGVPTVVAVRRFSGFNRTLVTASGLLSFGFGIFLAYQIGIVDGLFASVPVWIPR